MRSRRRRAAFLTGLAATGIVLGLGPADALGAVALPAPTLTGTPGDNGWFVSNVVVKWSPSDETTSSPGCLTQTLTTDTPGTGITCTVSDGLDTISHTVTVRIDRTPPGAVVATAGRPPDSGPFYTGPLPITWSGTDATSGIVGCTALTYTGPDGPAITPVGNCRDRAGNVSASVPLTFAYDTTAPTLTDLAVGVDAHRTATLRWSAGADAQSVTVVRRPGDGAAAARTVLDGPAIVHAAADGPLPAGMTYTYDVTVRDTAGNAATASTTATTPAAVAATSKKAKAKAKRLTLTWRARSKAKYYNFQLFRNGRKILSAWPTAAHYTLKTKWRYRGHTYRLSHGRYRWYVWPGYGRRAAHRYGKLVGHGRLAVPKKKP